MSFLVDSFNADFDTFENKLEAYRQYLESVRDSFPPDALAFATAPWHYTDDHKSPHDSWVESVSITEPSSGERHQHRQLEITVQLLGSYHDGRITLVYKMVRSYKLNTNPDTKSLTQGGHGDWLIDEIRLSDRGGVIHEVVFSRGGRWLIECEDIVYRWDGNPLKR